MQRLILILSASILSFYISCYAGNAVEILGIVSDAESGQPLSGVKIKISGLGIVFISDSSGSFQLEGLPQGSYIAEFSRLGYKTESAPLTIAENNNSCFVFRLIRLNVISPQVVVTADKGYSRSLEISGHSKALGVKELQQNLSQSIATTLKNEAGISITAMGAAPSRPVIRGLGGNRITFSEDGVKTNDLSGTSPDHAVAIDPFTIEKIEVVRGPKSLIGSGGASGGTVNIIKEIIPPAIPLRVTAEGIAFAETSNSGLMGGAKTEIPFGPFAMKSDFSYRKSGNIGSPGKILSNTGIESYSYSFGAGYRDDSFAGGASVNEFSMQYGIPGGFVGAHPNGVKIEMFRRRFDAKSIIDIHTETIDNIGLSFSRNYYRHTEYEAGNAIGAEYSMWNYTADLRANFSGSELARDLIAGATFSASDVKIGGYVFSPPAVSYNSALYAYNEIAAGDWEFRIGLRISYDIIHPHDYPKVSKIGTIEDKSFLSPSLAFSVINNVSDAVSIGFNLSRTVRHPSAEELFNEGPHLAAYSYETGNPSLKKEQSWEYELFGAYSSEWFKISFNLFLNDFDYFIIQRNTGKINYATLLPVYSAMGEKAYIAGFESAAEIKIPAGFSLDYVFSYTYGELTGMRSPLPMIAPAKLLARVKYSRTELETGIRVEFVSEQNRVDKFEQPTKGYTSFGIYGQYILTSGGILHNIAVNLENVFDTLYRNHLSRIKSIMPESGINMRLIYKILI